MIDNDRVKNLAEYELDQIACFYADYECNARQCNECPFELDNPYKIDGTSLTYRCALAYAAELYRRLTK